MYIPAGVIFVVIVGVFLYFWHVRSEKKYWERVNGTPQNKKVKLGAQGTKVLNRCIEIIDMLESKTSVNPSCLTELSNAIGKRLSRLVDIEEIKNNDVERLSWCMICDVGFNLLVSGQYHLHRGTLDPFRCGVNMERVYLAAMEEAVNLGFNEEGPKNETIKYYYELKNEVG